MLSFNELGMLFAGIFSVENRIRVYDDLKCLRLAQAICNLTSIHVY